MIYVNITKKKTCGRNNQPIPPMIIDYATVENVPFQFIDNQNKIQSISGMTGLHFAASLGIGQNEKLLFVTDNYTIENDVVSFVTDTYTTTYLEAIKKKYTEVNIEICQITNGEKRVLLRDTALACPRVYVEGSTPPQPSSDYYTKTETNALLSGFISSDEKGAVNGVASLGSTGTIPPSELPIATQSTIGAVRVESTSYAMQIKSTNCIAVKKADNTTIDNRVHQYAPIVPNNLDYAVRSVLDNVTEIPSETTSFSLSDASSTSNNHSKTYHHVPSTAPTYILPDVSSTATMHEIILYVDFTNATSLQFQDSNGTTISPMKVIDIATGQKYCFLCQYIFNKWNIMPVDFGGA